jgi:hypothetical protein
MSPRLHEQLLKEATRYGTAEVLRRMSAVYSPELEQAIRQGVHEAVLYYAECRDRLPGQPRSFKGGEAQP